VSFPPAPPVCRPHSTHSHHHVATGSALAALLLLACASGARAHRHLLQEEAVDASIDVEADGIPGPPCLDPAGAGKVGGHYRCSTRNMDEAEIEEVERTMARTVISPEAVRTVPVWFHVIIGNGGAGGSWVTPPHLEAGGCCSQKLPLSLPPAVASTFTLPSPCRQRV
jgi:hypothetical protein